VFDDLFLQDFRRIFLGKAFSTSPALHLVPTSKGLPDFFHSVVPKRKLFLNTFGTGVTWYIMEQINIPIIRCRASTESNRSI